MRLIIALASMMVCYAQTTISGTFKNPDGTIFNGSVQIALSRPTGVKNTCSTARIVRTAIVKITNGALGALSLIPTSCLNPAQAYTVRVYNSTNQIMYQSMWTVPNTGSADVTQLDSK